MYMANFHTKTFTKHDSYMTPEYAWDWIMDYIPRDKKIWECFYGDGSSGKYLASKGLNIIHEDIDFFKEDRGDICISNPPFSLKKECYTRLKRLGKPFIMISPSSVINTKYMYELFARELQIIIPPKRINFIKLVDGKVPEGLSNRCNFDCFYYCWKMNLPTDIVFISR